MFASSPSASAERDQRYETVILRTLNAFAVDVMTIPNEDDLFWYVARNVVGHLGFVDCVIYRANQAQTELTQVAALGEKNPFGRSILNPLKIPFGQGITGRVAQSGEAVIIKDLLEDEDYIPDTQPARSEICVPMVFGNRVVGVIDSEHPTPGAFGETELDVLVTVAAMTSAKLELLEEAERSSQRYDELVRSHAALSQEIGNRRALEAKLFEAQRLEAVGRLAGGFAHDFNNLLTVISGNLDLLAHETAENEHSDFVTAAQQASKVAAGLVQKMLQYSQQSVLNPELIELDRLVTETCRWSTNTFAEGIDVSLQLSGDLRPVKVDRNGTVNALLNLIINAQEAMPDGGTITISTHSVWLSAGDLDRLSASVPPGAYGCLTVKDTGTGVPPHIKDKIFDPFFTTKEAGTGTGLGLSTVLGFMQQSGGAVALETEEGAGTAFKLYFPTWNHQRNQ